MGTRGNVIVIDSGGRAVMNMYSQWDSYCENKLGLGRELVDFVTGGVCTNGLSGEDGKIFNGCGCFAAQLVAEFKEKPGSYYLYPVEKDGEGNPDMEAMTDNDYAYALYYTEESRESDAAKRITIEVYNWGKVVFKDAVENLDFVLKRLGHVPFHNEIEQNPLYPEGFSIDTPERFEAFIEEHKS